MRLTAGAVGAALAWAGLLAGRGGWWRAEPRLAACERETGPGPEPGSARVVAVVPARNEADLLPATLPTLLGQDGLTGVVVVDDQSEDGTAAVAAATGRACGGELRVVAGSDPPAGWTGKVWALQQGLEAAGPADLALLTDADVAHRPGSVRALVTKMGDDLDLVSLMAALPTTTPWERLLLPAFVYFFSQLYPFALVAEPRSRTAAAAGGCVLLRRAALERAGGLAAIRGAVIDDVALARLVKRSGGRLWLGHTDLVCAQSRGGGLGPIWRMVARSASTQLRHSGPAVAATVAGMLWLYALPPAAAVLGLVRNRRALGATGAIGTALMMVSYVPTLRRFGLPARRALSLPVVALLYAAMTVDSYRRDRRGTAWSWRGRPVHPGAPVPVGAETGE